MRHIDADCRDDRDHGVTRIGKARLGKLARDQQPAQLVEQLAHLRHGGAIAVHRLQGLDVGQAVDQQIEEIVGAVRQLVASLARGGDEALKSDGQQRTGDHGENRELRADRKGDQRIGDSLDGAGQYIGGVDVGFRGLARLTAQYVAEPTAPLVGVVTPPRIEHCIHQLEPHLHGHPGGGNRGVGNGREGEDALQHHEHADDDDQRPEIAAEAEAREDTVQEGGERRPGRPRAARGDRDHRKQGAETYGFRNARQQQAADHQEGIGIPVGKEKLDGREHGKRSAPVRVRGDVSPASCAGRDRADGEAVDVVEACAHEGCLTDIRKADPDDRAPSRRWRRPAPPSHSHASRRPWRGGP